MIRKEKYKEAPTLEWANSSDNAPMSISTPTHKYCKHLVEDVGNSFISHMTTHVLISLDKLHMNLSQRVSPRYISKVLLVAIWAGALVAPSCYLDCYLGWCS